MNCTQHWSRSLSKTKWTYANICSKLTRGRKQSFIVDSPRVAGFGHLVQRNKAHSRSANCGDVKSKKNKGASCFGHSGWAFNFKGSIEDPEIILHVVLKQKCPLSVVSVYSLNQRKLEISERGASPMFHLTGVFTGFSSSDSLTRRQIRIIQVLAESPVLPRINPPVSIANPAWPVHCQLKHWPDFWL